MFFSALLETKTSAGTDVVLVTDRHNYISCQTEGLLQGSEVGHIFYVLRLAKYFAL